MAEAVSQRNPVPKGAHAEIGFGLSPTHRNLRSFRRETVASCLAMAEGSKPLTAFPKTFEAIRTVAGLFSSIHLAQREDWFTVHKQFGQPSMRIAKEIAAGLETLAADLTAGRASPQPFGKLSELALPEMLENYMQTTEVDGVSPHPAADGWAYVLWSSSEPDLFVVDTTDLTVEEAIAEMASKPGHPYGIVAAWQVDDFETARSLLQRELWPQCLDRNVYHLETADGTMKLADLVERAGNVLESEGQFFLSPWHVDAPYVPERNRP